MTIVTPMMRQYQDVKEQYSDCLLFFRLGDFYEMFGEDAVTGSRELDLVLTSRDKTPMCGVPHHAVDNYIARLIAKGYKVAICEQLEDPKAAKGIVKRDVVRVVTPGTVVEENMLDEKRHNYLAACWQEKKQKAESGLGLAYIDISSGEFFATEFYGSDIRKTLADELTRIMPSELLLPQELLEDEFFSLRILHNCAGTLSHCGDESFVRHNAEELLRIHFAVASLEGLGLADKPLAQVAAAMVLDFLQQTQKRALTYIDHIKYYDCGEFMFLDAATRRNLELTSTLRGGSRRGSLLWVLDKTNTAMGGRLLREWIESPLLTPEAIKRRLDAVAELVENSRLREQLRESLGRLYDMPRLMGRVCYGSAGPRDLAALRQTLTQLPQIFNLLCALRSPMYQVLLDSFDQLEDILLLLEQAIAEQPPLSGRDSGVIRDSYNAEVDQLRQLSRSSKELLLQLEGRERERTGIKTLKVGFNKVFGYYIEISKSRAEEAPADYIRKQTLVNGERFITPELKELEDRILSAGDRLNELEYAIFCQVRDQVAAAAKRILTTAEVLAHVDVLRSLAAVAEENDYCQPLVDDGAKIMIREGRHPVVEKILGRENFIPNDTLLDRNSQRMMLITGPNMAGKSTYMRQVALITLLAQIGSFVPATAATIGCCDRLFTRVGAADDLTAGQSTFMVEMNETSNILRHATDKSLIVLDEIGRGTSTFDGLSIAWAVAEYIILKCGAKTLFATHYHELTALAESYPPIVNYSISVKEKGHDILFLRKIVEGAADKSYGIQVARLAGLPPEVLRRAADVLRRLEQNRRLKAEVDAEQLTFDDILAQAEQIQPEPELVRDLRELDVDAMTPLEALLKISQWKKEIQHG